MRVFVVGTGRCGTMTFAQACAHITNYTSAHESRHGVRPPDHWIYPDQHIEVDNRLSWAMGRMLDAYPDATWVWLRRNREAVAASYLKRRGLAQGLLPGYSNNLLRLASPSWQVALDMVDTIEANIRRALATAKGTVTTIAIETAKAEFPLFWRLIGAEGDLDAALGEFDVRHNASI